MTKLTFDDIDTSDGGIGTVANGYGRITWDNFYAIPADEYPGSGFETGATSGTQVAINGAGDTAVLRIDHGTFDLRNVQMTAAWDLKLKVQIDAYHGSEHVVHRVVTLTDAAPKLVHINAHDVDYVVFYPIRGSGIHDPNQTGDGNVIAFDDMRITDAHHDGSSFAGGYLVPSNADHPLAHGPFALV